MATSEKLDMSRLGVRLKWAIEERSEFSAAAIADVAGLSRQVINNAYTRDSIGDGVLLCAALLSRTSFIWLRFGLGSPDNFESAALEESRQEALAIARGRVTPGRAEILPHG